jgi:branched-chain amino acid aminotransferase
MVAGHGGQEGRALHYIDGTWHEGNPPLLGPMTHASWMSSIVFDGARAFEGVTPDIDRHCDRLIASARTMGLVPPLAAGEVEEIVHDGVGRFANGAALYIRPMLWAESGFIVPDPHSTRFCCTLFEAPMPEPKGLGVCLSPYRRPTPETALTLAKASCLYPNSVRAIQDAQARGFDNALIRDSMGNIADPGRRASLRAHPHPPGFPGGRRGLLHRQPGQGAADHPPGRPRSAAGADLFPRPPALLGLGARRLSPHHPYPSQ